MAIFNEERGGFMQEGAIVLAAASTYDKKFYFNPDFDQLPQKVKDELKIACVLHTADVGGIITIGFTKEGKIFIEATADEEDILYDEIGAPLKVKQLQREKKELFEALETYFKIFYLGEE